MYLIQHSRPMFILEELFCPKGYPKGFMSCSVRETLKTALIHRFAYDLDDFCLSFEPAWRSQQLSQGLKVRNRPRQMSLSEIMTILIAFHQSNYRNFKHYYLDHVCVYWAGEFPRLSSYQRFVEWMPSTLLPLCVYLKRCFGKCTGISFIDATSIKVCHAEAKPSSRRSLGDDDLRVRAALTVDMYLKHWLRDYSRISEFNFLPNHGAT